MSLTVSTDGSGENFAKLDEGIYTGTCYRIIDLGTTDQEYKGQVNKKHRVHISFEVTKALDPETNAITMDDGRPFSVSKTYTMSLFEAAALRKDLEAWRGKSFTEEELGGFDLQSLLGCSARIEVGKTKPTEFSEGGNPKIMNLQRPDGGIQKVETVNEIQSFDLDVYCDEFRGKSSDETKAMCDVFETLPQWQQEDIEKSYEYLAANENNNTPAPAKTEEAESLSSLADKAATEMNSPDFDEDNKKESDIPF
jgi:hypothetical protein|tara:strand:+ start:2416 stop:3174 length:759 start_codon:yes stop_codon:yes gene_type:complete